MSDETRTYPNGYTISLEVDEYPEDPRTWDNLGVMACAHRRYTLGDEQIPDDITVNGLTTAITSWGEVFAYLKREKAARCLLPLYLFDHSGLTMRTDSRLFQACDAAGWDWGMVGYIYTTTERLKAAGLEKRKAAWVRGVLEDEVRTYDAFLRGDVVRFVVRDPSGEVVDACGGFYPEPGPDPYAHVWAEAEDFLPDRIGHALVAVGAGL